MFQVSAWYSSSLNDPEKELSQFLSSFFKSHQNLFCFFLHPFPGQWIPTENRRRRHLRKRFYQLIKIFKTLLKHLFNFSSIFLCVKLMRSIDTIQATTNIPQLEKTKSDQFSYLYHFLQGYDSKKLFFLFLCIFLPLYRQVIKIETNVILETFLL